MSASSDSFCLVLMEVLGHFVWQGAALAVLAVLLAGVIRRASARARYGVLLGALVLMAACPVVTLVALDMPESSRAEVSVESGGAEGAASAEGFTFTKAPVPHAPDTLTVSDFEAESSLGWGGRIPPLLSGIYGAGVLVMLLRLVAGLIGGSRLRRRSYPVEDVRVLEALSRYARTVGLQFTPAIAFCERVAAPTLVGVVRPMVLLPASVMTGLSMRQVEFLLVHELAHVRRYDHWVNIFQRLVEALFFFHPGVWYVSHRIRVERENCCDDIVLAHGGNARAYAESLISVAACAGRAHTPAAALSATGKPSQLRGRILRLLGENTPAVRLGLSGWLMVGLVVVLGAAAFVEVGALDNEPSAETAEKAQTPAQEEPAMGDWFELEKQVDDPDWWLRKVAVAQLGDLENPPLTVVDALVKALKDENDQVQVAAAESLGKLKKTWTIKHLVAALKEHEVRNAAATALTNFDAKDVMPLLKLAVMDPDKEVRWGGLRALGMQTGDEARELLAATLQKKYHNQDAPFLGKALGGRETLLVKLAEDPEWSMRVKAGEVAAYVENFAPIEEAIVQLTEDENFEVRGTALSALAAQLGGERDQSILAALEAGLRDDHLGVAGVAARSLKHYGWKPKDDVQRAWYLLGLRKFREIQDLGPVAVEPLLHALQGDWSTGSVDDRRSIVDVLCALGDPRAVEPLSNLLREHMPQGFGMNDDVRLVSAIVDALAVIDVPTAVPVLIEGLEYPQVANECAQALGELKAVEAVPALIKALEDKNVRGDAAIGALVTINDPDGLRALIPMLEDTRIPGDYRIAVMPYLVKLGGPEVVAALSKAVLENGNRGIRIEAAQSLGELKAKQGVPALSQVLQQEQDPHVLKAAVDALGEIGGPEAVDALMNKKNVSQVTPEMVVEALAEIGGADSNDALFKIAEENSAIDLRGKITNMLKERGDPRWTGLFEAVSADAALRKAIQGE